MSWMKINSTKQSFFAKVYVCCWVKVRENYLSSFKTHFATILLWFATITSEGMMGTVGTQEPNWGWSYFICFYTVGSNLKRKGKHFLSHKQCDGNTQMIGIRWPKLCTFCPWKYYSYSFTCFLWIFHSTWATLWCHFVPEGQSLNDYPLSVCLRNPKINRREKTAHSTLSFHDKNFPCTFFDAARLKVLKTTVASTFLRRITQVRSSISFYEATPQTHIVHKVQQQTRIIHFRNSQTCM